MSGGPAVCLVAGIGVTPALAAAKTLETLNQPVPFVVHYSGRSRDNMACLTELESATQRSAVELVIRETAQRGRVDLSEIEKLARRFPGANWYLCGPPAYLHEVGQMLKQVRVSPERIHVEAFTPVGSPEATEEERTAFKRYLLVQPRPETAPRHALVLRSVGRSIWAFANSSLYPLKWLEKRLGRAARLDGSVPMEYLAIVSALSCGPFEYQLQAFSRLDLLRSAATDRAERMRKNGKLLPVDTPDGNTFSYWMPVAPFPKFPEKCRVDTGWTKVGEGKFVPVYVTRSRTVIEHLLRSSDHSDRGPLPYHYFQQTLGRTDIPSCPGRMAAGLFAGQIRDNATWTEDRALSTDIFAFSTIDHFGPLMTAAAEEVCRTIDEVVERDPDTLIDLNVMLSKVAYTVIVRAAFGNVDLAEMHALGRTLSEAIRKSFAYMWEFVMGRQSIPEDYTEALEAARLTNKKMIDLLRDLDRQGRLSDAQRSIRLVRMILETADEPDGGYEKLYALLMPLVIAGHETTGHAMSWAVYELSRNPGFEKLLFAEIEDFRMAHGGRPITTQDYDERPLSSALLAECLRRHAPIQSIPRTTTEDGIVPPDPATGIGGFRYPAGAMVVFSFIGVHLDPVRWHDPLKFRPERWLEGVRDEMSAVEKGRIVRANMRAREQASDWQPFSDGPGRCPGQHFNAHEFFVVMDALLPRYRFEFEHPNATVPHSSTMVVGPEVGRMSVRIRRR
jgi:cytochrome P450